MQAGSKRQEEVRNVLQRVKSEGRTALSPLECSEVLRAYGVPLPREGVARSAAEAADLAADIGFPVVMKIVSEDILHKTEAGGVLVGVADREQAERAVPDPDGQRPGVQGRGRADRGAGPAAGLPQER